MSALSHSQHGNKIARIIEAELHENYPNFEVILESPHYWSYFKEGGIADLVISRSISRFPDELDSIDTIERWFPEKQLRAPVISLNIVSANMRSFSPETVRQMFINNSVNFENQWPKEVTVVYDRTPSNQYIEDSLPQFFLTIDLGQPGNIEKILIPNLRKILDRARETPANDLANVTEFVSKFKSAVFHFNEVKHAYENDRIGPLILLLSVYFESHCFQELESHLKTLKKNPNAGSFLDRDQDRFKRVLDMCRYFDVISDDQYRIINETRKSRNGYAHTLESYHMSEKTDLEAEGLIDEAIGIYEELVGVQDSIVD